MTLIFIATAAVAFIHPVKRKSDGAIVAVNKDSMVIDWTF
jgi:hypothetical protein